MLYGGNGWIIAYQVSILNIKGRESSADNSEPGIMKVDKRLDGLFSEFLHPSSPNTSTRYEVSFFYLSVEYIIFEH